MRRLVKIHSSEQHRQVILGLHLGLCCICSCYFSQTYFYLSMLCIAVSMYYHWLHWPQKPVRLICSTQKIHMAGNDYTISQQSQVGFFWIRMVLSGNKKQTIWIFKDSVCEYDYRYLAKMISTQLMSHF